MQIETGILLSKADRLVDAVLNEGRKRKLSPLTVVVLDAGGHVIVAKREDNSGIMRFEVAFGKAWGALGMGRPSRDFEAMSGMRPVFVTTLSGVAQGRFVPVPGGVLVKDVQGRIIGAVGVSGDTSDEDEHCALVGIAAVGYVSDPAPSGGQA